MGGCDNCPPERSEPVENGSELTSQVRMQMRFRLLKEKDRKSTRLNSSHANIYNLSLHDALPILFEVRSTPVDTLRSDRKRRTICWLSEKLTNSGEWVVATTVHPSAASLWRTDRNLRRRYGCRCVSGSSRRKIGRAHV